MRQPRLLRHIGRIERFLPAMPGADASTAGRRRQRRALWAALVPSWILAVMQIVRARADLAVAWPTWQPMLVELALLVAGAVLVAAAAAGVHAWRQHA